MKLVEGDTYKGKARWRRVVFQGKATAHLSCPECGVTGLLSDHVIAASGLIAPSVDCPTKGCTFHVVGVILEGWKG